MGEACLEIKGVEHYYGPRKVLDIPRLTVRRGEILVLLGPNGSGKSSLLRLLNLLEKPDKGCLVMDGEAVRSSRRAFEARRKMAMVFQDPLLFNATVFDNVAYGLRVRRHNRSAVQAKVQAVLERTGIADLSERPAAKLSGGEARRVSLARALVVEPEIFFLDEPFVSVDQPTRERLREDLRRVLKDGAQTTVFVTHDQGEALIMADRLAVMKDGRILQAGRPEDIIYSPSDAWVAGFVGMDTVLSGTVVSRQQEFAVVEVGSRLIKAVLPPGVTGRVRIGIRPEEVMLSRAFEPAGQPRQRAAANGPSAGPKPNENVFRGRITEVTPQGLLLKIQLDCEFPLASLIPNELMSGVGFRPGQVIDASFDPNAVCLIAD